MMPMRTTFLHVALAGAFLANFAPAAGAQEAGERPLTLSVTPSGVEADPLTRLDELLARRERRNVYLFRSICRGCSNSERFSGNGSFDPAAELARRPERPDG